MKLDCSKPCIYSQTSCILAILHYTNSRLVSYYNDVLQSSCILAKIKLYFDLFNESTKAIYLL